VIVATLPELEEIARVTAIVFGVFPRELYLPRRPDEVAHARHAAVAIARAIHGTSYPALGRHFCRDHSTMMSSHRRARHLANTDPNFARRATEAWRRLVPHPGVVAVLRRLDWRVAV